MRYRIAIGADHGGFELKEELKGFLLEMGHQVQDLGCYGQQSVNYPDFASLVARSLCNKEADRGILICGTGIGMSIVANRYPGVRAALCHDLYTAIMSRKHNDANCLALGGRLLGKGLAKEIVKVWLETPFEGGRHELRLAQIRELEKGISDQGGGC